MDVVKFIEENCSTEIKERLNDLLCSTDLDERMDICDEILTDISFSLGDDVVDQIEEELKDLTLS